MTTENSQPAGNDPMQAVAHAMNTAAAAVRDGACDASARVQKILPEAGKFVSRFVYTTCYFTSYGVVFPAVFVANFVPGMGPIAAGVNDSAKAAREYVGDMRTKSAARRTAVARLPGPRRRVCDRDRVTFARRNS